LIGIRTVPGLETNDTDATVAKAFAALDAMSAQMVRTGCGSLRLDY